MLVARSSFMEPSQITIKSNGVILGRCPMKEKGEKATPTRLDLKPEASTSEPHRALYAKLSRKHAILEWRENQVWLTYLGGSPLGIRVGEKKLNGGASIMLRDMDLIQLTISNNLLCVYTFIANPSTSSKLFDNNNNQQQQQLTESTSMKPTSPSAPKLRNIGVQVPIEFHETQQKEKIMMESEIARLNVALKEKENQVKFSEELIASKQEEFNQLFEQKNNQHEQELEKKLKAKEMELNKKFEQNQTRFHEIQERKRKEEHETLEQKMKQKVDKMEGIHESKLQEQRKELEQKIQEEKEKFENFNQLREKEMKEQMQLYEEKIMKCQLQMENKKDDVNFKEKFQQFLSSIINECLECGSCGGLVNFASVLACGHVFCKTCLRAKECISCHHEIAPKNQSGGKYFSMPCIPMDFIVDHVCDAYSRLFHEKLQLGSLEQNNKVEEDSIENKIYFTTSKIDYEEKQNHSESILDTNKKMRLEQQILKEQEMENRCDYCMEPAHEEGMRCPHKSDNLEEEDESDLEGYI